MRSKCYLYFYLIIYKKTQCVNRREFENRVPAFLKLMNNTYPMSVKKFKPKYSQQLSKFKVIGFDSDYNNWEDSEKYKTITSSAFSKSGLENQSVYLSTCCRHEIYTISDIDHLPGNRKNGIDAVYKFILTALGITTPLFRDANIYHQIRAAIRSAAKSSNINNSSAEFCTQLLNVAKRIERELKLTRRQSVVDFLFNSSNSTINEYSRIAIVGTGDIASEVIHYLDRNRFYFYHLFSASRPGLILQKSKSIPLSQISNFEFDFIICCSNHFSKNNILRLKNIDSITFFDFTIPSVSIKFADKFLSWHSALDLNFDKDSIFPREKIKKIIISKIDSIFYETQT